MPSTTSTQSHSGLKSQTGVREGMNTMTLQPPVKFALPWGRVQTVHKNKQSLQITLQNEWQLCETKHTELWCFSWIHQTKYFGLDMFLNYVCIFCPSWSQLIRILLNYHLHQSAKCEIILHFYSSSKDISAKQNDLLLRRQKPQTGCVVCKQFGVRMQVALCDSTTSRNCEWVR
jgi:hypothetical protein